MVCHRKVPSGSIGCVPSTSTSWGNSCELLLFVKPYERQLPAMIIINQKYDQRLTADHRQTSLFNGLPTIMKTTINGNLNPPIHRFPGNTKLYGTRSQHWQAPSGSLTPLVNPWVHPTPPQIKMYLTRRPKIWMIKNSFYHCLIMFYHSCFSHSLF